MKHIITTGLLLLATNILLAQQIIKGKVIDKNTRQPIEFASVIIEGCGKGIMTDKLGDFKLKLPADTAILTISLVGYQSQQIKSQHHKLFIIELERGAVDLKELTISAHSNNNSFHTICGLDLNLRPVNSSQDLMRLVPGLFIAQHMGGGKAEQIFFRGFDADHGTDINVSVDGMPVNMVSHIHGQGYADLHFLIPETVDNYDFGKGPYYSGYGDFTTAGYLSYTTKDVLDKSMIKLEGGQFNTGRAVAMINLLSNKAKQNGTSAYIAADGSYTDGPFDLPENFSRLNLFGKFATRIGLNNKLSASVSTFTSQWKASGEIPERAVAEGLVGRFGTIDSSQGGYTSRTNVNVKLTSSLKNDFILENQLYYTNYNFQLRVNNTFFAEDTINGDAFKQKESRDMFGYNGKLSKRSYFKNTTLTSTAGIGARFDRTHNSEFYHINPQGELLEYDALGDINEDNINAYLEESLEKDKWLFNVGARVDYLHFSYLDKLNAQLPARSNVIFSPKVNIQYTANSTTQLYLKLGKGFHSNDARAVVANNGLQTLPAAYGADLGINWKPAPRLLINGALWYLYLQQEFVLNDDGLLEPGDKTRRIGMDVSARYQFNKWLFANANINVANPRDAELPKGENYLPLAPTFTSTGGIDIKLKNGINGGISYRYMHKRPGNEDYTLIADGYFVSDLTVNYTRKKYEIGVTVENIFNTKWTEFASEEVTRLKGETDEVDQMSFTPGTPFFAKLKLAVFF